jgi:hypothetical protein
VLGNITVRVKSEVRGIITIIIIPKEFIFNKSYDMEPESSFYKKPLNSIKNLLKRVIGIGKTN